MQNMKEIAIVALYRSLSFAILMQSNYKFSEFMFWKNNSDREVVKAHISKMGHGGIFHLGQVLTCKDIFMQL